MARGPLSTDCGTNRRVLLSAGGGKVLSPRLLAGSKAPLFAAQEFAGRTTGRISQRRFAASVGGEECLKGLNGAFCWLVTPRGRRVLRATARMMVSLCLLAQEDQRP